MYYHNDCCSCCIATHTHTAHTQQAGRHTQTGVSVYGVPACWPRQTAEERSNVDVDCDWSQIKVKIVVVFSFYRKANNNNKKKRKKEKNAAESKAQTSVT